jgi:hypothetical protein
MASVLFYFGQNVSITTYIGWHFEQTTKRHAFTTDMSNQNGAAAPTSALERAQTHMRATLKRGPPGPLNELNEWCTILKRL